MENLFIKKENLKNMTRNEILNLKNKIIEANKQYRIGNPCLTDQEYDNLCDLLHNNISNSEWDSFRSRLFERDGKVKHPFPMGSLTKFKYEEPKNVYEWMNGHINKSLNISAKVDGISARLTYINGKLISATTRGNGYCGEDITDKIFFIKEVPQTINFKDEIDKNIQDMMLISYLLNKNMRSDIAYLANSYGADIRFYDKIFGSELTIKLPTDDSYIKDVMKKANFIYQEYPNLEKELQQEELENLYKEIELPLCYVLTQMELNGFLVDKDYLIEMGKDIDASLEKIEKRIYEIAGIEFNISSPKKLAEVLFIKLEIPYPKKIKDNNYSTSKEILDKLKDSYEIVSLILDYRALFKMKTSYINGIINEIKSDSKIHTIFNQTLTRTGRLSSERPNLQNIPIRDEMGKLVRKAFIPSLETNKIASFDYSQIELRVFASMANADNMIEAFKHGLDIHAKTASEIFHVPITEVTKDMRRKAKAVNFGILYGISGFGLAEDLGISPKEGKDFIEEYLKTYPGVSHYMKMCIKNAHECGYVKTIMNRKRVIPELNNKNRLIVNMGERMALNTPIQGSSADILKKAMNEIDAYFSKHNLRSKMILQIHDELVFNVHKDELMEVKNIVKDIMENTYKLSVPLKVDIEVGYNLYEAK